MNRHALWIIITLLTAACSSTSIDRHRLKAGVWRATVEIQGHELPFNFEVARSGEISLINASERLLLDEVDVQGDSIGIALHIFDADIKAVLVGDTLLRGEFVKNDAENYRLPFEAVHGVAHRFFDPSTVDNGDTDISGKYAVTFVNNGDSSFAVALFEQRGAIVTGTFMKQTGDYRFLEGNVRDSTMYLSAFDGNHVYLFSAAIQADGSLHGEFRSGKTRHDTWFARKDEYATLPDANALTSLKDGYETISFAFPNADGDTVALDDPKYRNKVVILQLLGTWCPNCMDETQFLAPWYDANKSRGVEIIGLAYERKADFDYASTRVRKMADKLNVNYDVLIAGTDKKGEAAKTLPMLSDVAAFPTTIFIGKDGKVRKIHTGFSGPGTGEYYEQFKKEFNETVDALLSEDLTANL